MREVRLKCMSPHVCITTRAHMCPCVSQLRGMLSLDVEPLRRAWAAVWFVVCTRGEGWGLEGDNTAPTWPWLPFYLRGSGVQDAETHTDCTSHMHRHIHQTTNLPLCSTVHQCHCCFCCRCCCWTQAECDKKKKLDKKLGLTSLTEKLIN